MNPRSLPPHSSLPSNSSLPPHIGEDRPAEGGAARASVVNRTHRIIREQATTMRDQRTHSRGLWAPLLISSIFLLVICYAVWALTAGYDLTPTGIPDASDQVLLLLLWPLPITVVVLGLIWLRRSRGRQSGGEQTL